jgi:mannose-6-phosphate isomerase-like protein (cupin superfamily)
MRLLITVLFAATAGFAQKPDVKTFSSAAEVAAMMNKAKSERKPDQANFIDTLLQSAPYTVNLEYRVRGVDTPPSVHPVAQEICYVIEGAGTLTTGGKLQGAKPAKGGNVLGESIGGGSSRHVAKGDFFLIPENTPHAFHTTAATLVIMSMHLPVESK